MCLSVVRGNIDELTARQCIGREGIPAHALSIKPSLAKPGAEPSSDCWRLTSSRNAVRHGLCCPLPFDMAQFDCIALAFAKAGDPTLVADDLAHSYLEMERIRRVRRQMLASLFEVWSPGEFKRLAKLDRYERSALKKAYTLPISMLASPETSNNTAIWPRKS